MPAWFQILNREKVVEVLDPDIFFLCRTKEIMNEAYAP